MKKTASTVSTYYITIFRNERRPLVKEFEFRAQGGTKLTSCPMW